MEVHLAETINTEVDLKLIVKSEISRVIVDSTAQQIAIAHRTDSRLLEVAYSKYDQAAKDAGLALKQTFVKECKHLRCEAGRYADAKQFRRMRKASSHLRMLQGRLVRKVECKTGSSAAKQAL